MPNSQTRAFPRVGSKLRLRRKATAKVSAARSSANVVPTLLARNRWTRAKLSAKAASKASGPSSEQPTSTKGSALLARFTLCSCRRGRQALHDGVPGSGPRPALEGGFIPQGLMFGGLAIWILPTMGRQSLFFDGQTIDLLEDLNGDEIGALELDSARIVPEGGKGFEGFPPGDGYTVTLVRVRREERASSCPRFGCTDSDSALMPPGHEVVLALRRDPPAIDSADHLLRGIDRR